MGMLRGAIANSRSMRARFAVSLFSNVFRSILGFIGGLLVARGLDPAGYGDLSFLLGSFNSLRTLLDLGSSNAFYTFISQRHRSKHFYWLYYGWLGVQFLVVVLLLFLLMPEVMIQKLWLGHGRDVLLLAFLASFIQQQVWQTINQAAEAARQTFKIQLLNLGLGISHLLLISLLLVRQWASVHSILWLYVAEYAVASLIAFPVLRGRESTPEVEAPPASSFRDFLRETWQEYRKYCAPLVVLTLAGFLGDFLDKWLLQRFGGAQQQGLYQISFQFSAVSLLVTTSILRIFWKEVSEAHDAKNTARAAQIYLRVCRALVMFSAILSAAMIPWSKQIVEVALGPRYLMAWPVLAILFLYPIHQSLGQIGGTMLLATHRTRAYMWLTLMVMAVGLLSSYLTQAPRTGLLIPGLGLGAVGLALKMVVLNIASVNLQAYVIARHLELKFDWLYQALGVPLAIAWGFLAKGLIFQFWNESGLADPMSLAAPLAVYCLLYLAGVVAIILAMPWLAGLQREEIKSMIAGVWSKRAS